MSEIAGRFRLSRAEFTAARRHLGPSPAVQTMLLVGSVLGLVSALNSLESNGSLVGPVLSAILFLGVFVLAGIRLVDAVASDSKGHPHEDREVHFSLQGDQLIFLTADKTDVFSTAECSIAHSRPDGIWIRTRGNDAFYIPRAAVSKPEEWKDLMTRFSQKGQVGTQRRSPPRHSEGFTTISRSPRRD